FMRPDAMATPKVPPNTSSIGPGAMIAAGLPPSMIIDAKMAMNPKVMPAKVPGSISVPSVGVGHHAQGGYVGGGELELLGERDHRGAELPHLVDDVLDAVFEDVLGPVDECQHRVGRGFRPLDEVAVQRHRVPVQA